MRANKLKKAIGYLFFGVGLFSLGAFLTQDYRVERKVRAEAVQLFGNGHSCSGVHVHTKRASYILTAGHCKVLATPDGYINAVNDEMGAGIPRKILAEDPLSDLLLLEPLPSHKGIDVATRAYQHEKLISFTHGSGYPTHRTEGEYIGKVHINVALNQITNDEEEQACSMPKHKKIDMDFLFFHFRLCVLDVDTYASTLAAAPGSSGGPVVNKSGKLIGLVSAGNEKYSYLVQLEDVQRFLQDW